MSEISIDHLRTDFTGATLASSLAARLRKAIMDGELAPGSKLRLEDLRAAYGVSLSPLREALSRLSMDGLVEVEEQKGYRVAPVSLENFVDVTDLRIELETMALKRAIAEGDDSWESDLVAALHRLTKLESQGEERNIESWELAHRTFHNILIAAAHRPMLLKTLASLHDLSDRYRRIILRQRSFDRDVNAEHRAIADAALARNAKEATRLLRQHVERTTNNIREVLLADRSSSA